MRSARGAIGDVAIHRAAERPVHLSRRGRRPRTTTKHSMRSGWAMPPSNQPRFAEAVIAAAGGVGVGPAEDDVVEQIDVHGLRGLAKLAGLCELPDYGK